MNDEATRGSAEGDRNSDPMPQGRQPAAPAWESPPVQPQSGAPFAAQTAPWEAAQPGSGAPFAAQTPPWEAAQPGSGAPFAAQTPPWEAPQPRSGPPASPWNPGLDADSTAALPSPVPPQFNADPTLHHQRIVPSAPKKRGRSVGWIAGIVVALLAGGAGGYYLGGAGTGAPGAETSPTPSATALALFEATQMATNRQKLDGELAGLAAPWLPSLGNCVSNVEKDAPPLGGEESRHVTCRYGSAWVHFMVYKGPEQKNAARNYRQQLNLNSDEIAPGVQDPGRTTGGVTKAHGKLVEYAFRRKDGRAICGISWERDEDPLAASMIEAFCEEDLGGKWEPLRDLWHRHS